MSTFSIQVKPPTLRIGPLELRDNLSSSSLHGALIALSRLQVLFHARLRGGVLFPHRLSRRRREGSVTSVLTLRLGRPR